MLIYDILDGVRENPALVMGSKSITVLRSFLDGAGYASRILGIDDCYNDFAPIPFRFFNDYVAHYYNCVESTAGWANILLDKNNGDEQASFDMFYTLLDNFRTINISKIHRCTLSQDQINYPMENEYASKRVLHNNFNQTEPLFIQPKAVYIIELSNKLGYLCMIEGCDSSYLHSSLLTSTESAIEYFTSNFGGSYHWSLVESIPAKYD